MPPTNSYPAALNSWLNPGGVTLRNDPGYELASVVTQLQQHAAAMEGKVGSGASTPPATGAVLRRTATGQSGWGQVVSADIADGTIVGADIAPKTVDDAKMFAPNAAGVLRAVASGNAAAFGKILSADVTDANVLTQHLADGLVTTAKLAPNAVSQAIGKQSSAAFSVTGVAMAGDTGLSQSITTTGGVVIALIIATMQLSAASNYGRIGVLRDGGQVSNMINYFGVASVGYIMTTMVIETPAAGAHTYALCAQTLVAGQTISWFADGARYMLLLELKR